MPITAGHVCILPRPAVIGESRPATTIHLVIGRATQPFPPPRHRMACLFWEVNKHVRWRVGSLLTISFILCQKSTKAAAYSLASTRCKTILEKGRPAFPPEPHLLVLLSRKKPLLDLGARLSPAHRQFPYLGPFQPSLFLYRGTKSGHPRSSIFVERGLRRLETRTESAARWSLVLFSVPHRSDMPAAMPLTSLPQNPPRRVRGSITRAILHRIDFLEHQVLPLLWHRERRT